MDESQSCCDPTAEGVLRADLTEVALRLSRAGFAALWGGRPLEPAVLLPDAPDAAAEASAVLAARGRAELDAAGRLVGIHGITLHETRHSFVHDGTVRHTWCAFDSVGIPAALGIDATVQTSCPACSQPLSIEVRAGRIAVHDCAVLWLPSASPSMHLIQEFCSAADLYCSEAHLRQWVTDSARGRLTRLDEAVELGCTTWLDIVGMDLTDSGLPDPGAPARADAP